MATVVQTRRRGSDDEWADTNDYDGDQAEANAHGQADRWRVAGRDARVVDRPAPLAEHPPATAAGPDPREAEIAALRAENARLRADQAELARVQAALAEPAHEPPVEPATSAGTEGSH